ncbi:MAG: tyrosine-type recombinase/integrase [Roseitalea sp.]|nr:tyrosine-type recombinase/integrase [Roseitalea sp.]MBO6953778.1 tyrosine-type recombinase/integrase [Rhizobiaceae bacterium]MBO6594126.1 tyrosine-type recombinase/integrase [Roseitalea sp.]MBO6601441.1 tyrosine-type recombinase/integrase [Roseitalea sp.]MBO6613531.1 tyrosine-type recombinase/integrase [Roseitalea sp.]
MLTDAKARRIKPDDRAVADGSVPGLYLSPSTKSGRGKWTFRFVSPETQKRRDMGMGAYPDTSIASARESARKARECIVSGIDPIEERRRAAEHSERQIGVPTFRAAACEVHADIAPGFRNRKHAAQWISTLETHAFQRIGGTPVDQLTARDFAEVLKPIWLSKPETASRLRQRMHRVMNWCAAHGHVSASPLPAIDDLLPRQPGKAQRVVHFPAVPWRDCPAVIAQLFENTPLRVSKQTLLFLVLTAARSGEVRGLPWSEIDWSRSLWIVPAERAKTRQPHRVPLSSHAMAILKDRATMSDGTGLVFESCSGGQLSDMTLTKILRDANIPSDVPGRTATVHGFRSSFRDWASENGYPRDVAERALAHTVRNQVEAAYHRTDLLDQRRSMMDRWAEFVTSSLV